MCVQFKPYRIGIRNNHYSSLFHKTPDSDFAPPPPLALTHPSEISILNGRERDKRANGSIFPFALDNISLCFSLGLQLDS
jgi:hypothetical protein